MEHRNITDMSFYEIISLLGSTSLDKNTYTKIFQSLPKVIRKNFRYISDDSEDQEEVDEDQEYENLLGFFKNLIIFKKIDLLTIGLETLYDIDENRNMILYDLALTFFKNNMLKEYYEIVTKFNNNKYFVDEALTEVIDDMFLDISPDNIYYLITETAVFTLKNRHYQLMKFIINKWDSTEFPMEEMSAYDIERTAKTVDLLKDAINKRYTASK